MPKYKTPVFPSAISIWRNGNAPPALPDVSSTCQLNAGRRSITPYQLDLAMGAVPGTMHVLLPAGTDIRDAKAPAGPDLVELPVGSLRMYEVAFVDDIGLGFLNEHRFAMLRGIPSWPLPFPFGGYPFAPAVTLLGTGTSGGIAVNGLVAGVVSPASGFLLLRVAFYNQAAVPLVTIGALGPVPTSVSPAIGALGIVAQTATYIAAIPPGAVPITITFPPALQGELQWQATLLASSRGLIDFIQQAVGNIPPPVLGGFGAIAVPPEPILGGMAVIAPAGPTGLALPYVNNGGDVNDLIGLVPVLLTGGDFISTTAPVPVYTHPFLALAGWTGILESYQ